MHRKLSCGVVQDPIIRPLAELDAQSLEALLQDIPLWVKNPDYDRVLTYRKSFSYAL